MNEKDNDKGKPKLGETNKDWMAITVSIITIAASAFGIIAFFRTCTHETELKSLNYVLNSLNYQPKLKLATSPHILSTQIDTLSVKFREHPNRHSGATKDPHPVDIQFRLTIDSKISITNIDQTDFQQLHRNSSLKTII
jgi:hypothetical protein